MFPICADRFLFQLIDYSVVLSAILVDLLCILPQDVGLVPCIGRCLSREVWLRLCIFSQWFVCGWRMVSLFLNQPKGTNLIYIGFMTTLHNQKHMKRRVVTCTLVFCVAYILPGLNCEGINMQVCPLICPCVNNCTFAYSEFQNCPPRFTTLNAGATALHDCVCIAGYAGNWTSGCVECVGTEYCPINSVVPVNCPEGYECNTSIANPLPGIWVDNPSVFQLCPGGYTCSRAWDKEPIPCVERTYCGNGSDASVPCPAKFWCGNVSSAPVACPAQYFCPAESGSPLDCPSGSFCVADSDAPFACIPGYSCPALISFPVICPVGSVCNETGMSSPLPCPVGMFCLEGTIDPVPCADGLFCAEGTDTPLPCPAGFYCVSGTPYPITCPAGRRCPVGTSFPIPCDAGFYCEEGVFNQTICPPAAYCGFESGNFTACPASYFCPEGSPLPTLCPASSMCPAGSAMHEPCMAGYFCGVGVDSGSPCPMGFFCVANTSVPVACAPGVLCLEGSVDEMVLCPGGMTCNSSEIALCSEGKFCVPGSWVGETCTEGYYCVAGTSEPIACDPGILCLPGSIDNRNLCPGGNVCINGVASPCQASLYCPMGSYAGVSCPEFYFCPGGSEFPVLCPSNAICLAAVSSPCYNIPQHAEVLNSMCMWNCSAGFTANVDYTKCIEKNTTSFATLLDFSVGTAVVDTVFLESLTKQVEDQSGCGVDSQCQAVILSITFANGTVLYCDKGVCPGYSLGTKYVTGSKYSTAVTTTGALSTTRVTYAQSTSTSQTGASSSLLLFQDKNTSTSSYASRTVSYNDAFGLTTGTSTENVSVSNATLTTPAALQIMDANVIQEEQTTVDIMDEMEEKTTSEVNEEILFGRRRLLQTAASPSIAMMLISFVPVLANSTFNISIEGASIQYTASFNLVVNNTLLNDLKTLVIAVQAIVESQKATPKPVVQTTQNSDQSLIIGIVAGVCAFFTAAGLATYIKSKRSRRKNRPIEPTTNTADDVGAVEAGRIRLDNSRHNSMFSQFHITESLIPVRITLTNLIHAQNISPQMKSR